MYGNLREIDIRSLLALIESGQRTGQLLVETSALSITQDPLLPESKSVPISKSSHSFWLIAFTNGQITYAVDSTRLPLQRLQDYLRRYQVESALEQLPQTESTFFPTHPLKITGRTLPEYNYLWLLLEHHVLSATQGKHILYSMVNETLFDLLSLCQGYFVFHSSRGIEPQLTQIQITPVVRKATRQLQQWKQLYPYITSPEQCPLITKTKELQKALTPSAYRSVALACQGQLSLRRIARYLNKDLLTLSQALYPYIQEGLLQLLESEDHFDTHFPEEPENGLSTLKPKILCLREENHEDHQESDQIEYKLKQQGYSPIILNDPIEALSVIVREQPHLIFCQLEMSALPGEEIAYLLRNLPALAKIPIILVIPETSDPLRLTRARLLGVTQFLMQPVQDSELLSILGTYLGGFSEQPQS